MAFNLTKCYDLHDLLNPAKVSRLAQQMMSYQNHLTRRTKCDISEKGGGRGGAIVYSLISEYLS